MIGFVACSGESAPRAPKPAKGLLPPQAAAAEKAEPEEPEAEYRYDPAGKPDPFRSFVRVNFSDDPEAMASPLERFDLSQLNLTGVIWHHDEPRALITDPSGKGYIVGVGTAIGKNKGRVIQIDDNRVLVKETYVDFRDRATTQEIALLLYGTQGG